MTKTGAQTLAPASERAESFTDWVRANSRIVVIAAAVVLGATLIFWIARWNSANKAAQAGRALGEAQRAFASGNMALAQSDLQRVVQRYGGTTAGNQARLLLAQAFFAQSKVPDGLKVLDEAGNPKPFEASFHAVRAAGLEQAGKPAEAAAEYLQASEAALGAPEKAEYKAEAARAYVAAGNAAEAQKLLAEIASDDTNPLSQEAALRLGETTAKPVAK
jgi:predicted negative regulator of RcsB-dependent stress response